MTEKDSESFQLQGEELKSTQKLVSTAEDNLRQIAKVIRAKLRPSAGAHAHQERPKVARFYFDNSRIVIDYGGGDCEVLEDPPGICRVCAPGE